MGSSNADRPTVKMRRRLWRWTCVPVVMALAILCIAPAYLLLVRGTDHRGSGILRAEEAHNKEFGTTRSSPASGIRLSGTQQTSNGNKKALGASPVAVCCRDLMNLDKDRALIIGQRRKTKGFLTIGIPYTPLAGGKKDLKRTLNSLLPNTPSELLNSQVSIVIFTSALDVGFLQSARAIVSTFPDHVQSGLLQLIEAPRSFYPNPSFPWNSIKASLDNAFLLTYAAESSEFYLQLSSDLKAYPGYLQAVRDFIRQQGKKYWVALELYPVGFTGKLFRGCGRDLQQLIHLLTEYNKEQSLESLFVHFKNLNVQQGEILRRPPLFSLL